LLTVTARVPPSKKCTKRGEKIKVNLSALLLCIAVVFVPSASAQTWPNKPVRMVAVFPPGGSVDTVARILSFQLTKQLGQQFIVDNKGGASGSIGTAMVAKSPPDGCTFAVVFDTHGVNPSLIPNLPFDTMKDLAPVMIVGTSAMVSAVSDCRIQGFQGSNRCGQTESRRGLIRHHRLG